MNVQYGSKERGSTSTRFVRTKGTLPVSKIAWGACREKREREKRDSTRFASRRGVPFWGKGSSNPVARPEMKKENLSLPSSGRKRGGRRKERGDLVREARQPRRRKKRLAYYCPGKKTRASSF